MKKLICTLLLLLCLLTVCARADEPRGTWGTAAGDMLVFGSGQSVTLTLVGKVYDCTWQELDGILLLEHQGWYMPVTEGEDTLTLTMGGKQYVFVYQGATVKPLPDMSKGLKAKVRKSFTAMHTNSYVKTTSIDTLFKIYRQEKNAAAVAVRLIMDLAYTSYGDDVYQALRYVRDCVDMENVVVGYLGDELLVLWYDRDTCKQVYCVGYKPHSGTAWYLMTPMTQPSASACRNNIRQWCGIANNCYSSMTLPAAVVRDAIDALLEQHGVTTASQGRSGATSVPTATPKPMASAVVLPLNVKTSFYAGLTVAYDKTTVLQSSSEVYRAPSQYAINLMADLIRTMYPNASVQQVQAVLSGIDKENVFVARGEKEFYVLWYDAEKCDRVYCVGYNAYTDDAWYLITPVTPASVQACQSSIRQWCGSNATASRTMSVNMVERATATLLEELGLKASTEDGTGAQSGAAATATPKPTTRPSLPITDSRSFTATMANSYCSSNGLTGVKAIYGSTKLQDFIVRLLGDLCVDVYGKTRAQTMGYLPCEIDLSSVSVARTTDALLTIWFYEPDRYDRVISIWYFYNGDAVYSVERVNPATRSACDAHIQKWLAISEPNKRIASSSLSSALNRFQKEMGVALTATPKPTATPRPTATPKPAGRTANTVKINGNAAVSKHNSVRPISSSTGSKNGYSYTCITSYTPGYELMIDYSAVSNAFVQVRVDVRAKDKTGASAIKPYFWLSVSSPRNDISNPTAFTLTIDGDAISLPSDMWEYQPLTRGIRIDFTNHLEYVDRMARAKEIIFMWSNAYTMSIKYFTVKGGDGHHDIIRCSWEIWKAAGLNDVVYYLDKSFPLATSKPSATPRPTATPKPTARPTATPAPCSRCGGDGKADIDCTGCSGTGNASATCGTCSGSGKKRCSRCGNNSSFGEYCNICKGDGRLVCSVCEGTGYYYKNLRCTSCNYTGYKKCGLCGGDGLRACTWCNGSPKSCSDCGGDGRVSSRCTKCSGKGTQIGTCPDCKGTGKRSSATNRNTPRPTATPRSGSSSGSYSRGYSTDVLATLPVGLSGSAWESAGVADAGWMLDWLEDGYALRISYTARDNGHVWICLPHSKAGWSGIGQNDPIKRDGYVYIPYSMISRAAGTRPSDWEDSLYIKGNTDWKVTKIEIVRWVD